MLNQESMKPVFSRFFTSPEAGESTEDVFRGIISDAIIEPPAMSSAGLLPQGGEIQSGPMVPACSVTANSRSHLDLVSPIRMLLSPRADFLARRPPVHPARNEEEQATTHCDSPKKTLPPTAPQDE